jgi:hypothetical protein
MEKPVEFVKSKQSMSTKEVYCVLIANTRVLSEKVDIKIDSGNAPIANQEVKRELAGANEVIKSYSSMVDALNYMSSFGWELVSAYTGTGLPAFFIHYVMKKKVNVMIFFKEHQADKLTAI